MIYFTETIFTILNPSLIVLIPLPPVTQEQVVTPPEPAPAPEPQPPAPSPPAPDEPDLNWEDKEDKEEKADKLDAENSQTDDPTDKKYQYKEGVSLNLDAIHHSYNSVWTWSYLTYDHESIDSVYACFIANLGVALSFCWYETAVENDCYVKTINSILKIRSCDFQTFKFLFATLT